MHKLTQHQEDVADEVLTNLRTHKTALLSGISGVGKTTTTEYIVSKYQNARKQVWLAATTHKALEVLSKMMPSVNSTRISTLHSFLNMIPDKSGPNRPMIVNPRGQTKFTTLLVIDEYSMMTKDVIDALNDYRMMHDVDVLFVGDASQLILSKNDVDTLELDDKTSYLTEVMRQGRLSDIAVYSKMVSAFILEMGPEPIVPYGDEIIKYTDHDEFIRAWKKCKSAEKAILAFRNTTVKAYNTNIAKHYRHQTDEYEVGNRVVLRSLVATTKEDGSLSHTQDYIPNRRTVTIEKIIDKGDYWRVWSDEGSFMIPKTASWLKTKLQPLVSSMNWQQYYSEKEKYVLVHHADALTVHGAQGSSYDEVFIDASDMMTARENVRRMAYVGISRAKLRAHVFIGDKRNYSRFKPEIEDVEL